MLLACLEAPLDGLAPDAEQRRCRALVAAAAFQRAIDEQVFRGGELVAAIQLEKHVGETGSAFSLARNGASVSASIIVLSASTLNWLIRLRN